MIKFNIILLFTIINLIDNITCQNITLNNETAINNKPLLVKDGYVTEKIEVGTAKIYKIENKPRYVNTSNKICPRPAKVFIKTNCTCPTPPPCPEVDFLVCDPCPICIEETKTVYHKKIGHLILSKDDPDINYEFNSQSQFNKNTNKLNIDLNKVFEIYPKLSDFLNSDVDYNNIFNIKQKYYGVASPLTLLCISVFDNMKKDNNNIFETITTIGRMYNNNAEFSCSYKYRMYEKDNIDTNNGIVYYNKYTTEIPFNALPFIKLCNSGEMKKIC